jgi:hypothetical protein
LDTSASVSISFTSGLFFTAFALCAKLQNVDAEILELSHFLTHANVELVSSTDAGVMVAIIRVFAFPPRESFNNHVSFESRKLTYS